MPVSVEMLIEGWHDSIIIIHGSSLEEHIDLLIQLCNTTLIPTDNESYINARIYCAFETKEEGNIFDVAMWGGHNSIFVNGLEVKWNAIYCDVILPFLPEEPAQELREYVDFLKERFNQ